MMRWLLRACLALLVLVPVAGVGALWLALEDQPRVVHAVVLRPEDIARARMLLERNDPRRMRPGVLRTVSMSQQDLELSLSYLASRYARGAARVVVLDGSATLLATLALQANPVGRHLNLDAAFRAGGRLPAVERLRIGRLPVPGFVCNWLLARAIAWLERSERYDAVTDVIRSVEMDNGLLRVDFEWTEAAAGQLRTALVPPAEQARWKAYQARLVELAAQGAGMQQLPLERLLGPLLQLSQQRAAGAGAEAENRALLVVLAFYVNGKGLAALAPAARDWPRPRSRRVTLAGRTDFPQHFTISAALAASAGSQLSDAVGLYKEVDDARAGSGFSFSDIAADRAGTRFGALATTGPAAAARLYAAAMRGLREADLIPDVRDLPEFMPESEFRRRFGGIGQPAYRNMLTDIERRIAALPLYR